MWVMSYTTVTSRRTGPPLVEIGHRVTTAHPLVTVDEWNRRASEDVAAGRALATGRTVLTWYAPLSEEEQSTLTAAGVDLAAVSYAAFTS